MKRRILVGYGLALTPLAALLSACTDEGTWPEGMVPFKWDRDTCTRCKMTISDRRFATQIRGGPNNMGFKFDDIGCATTWRAEKLKVHPWMTDASTHFWVAEFGGKGEQWIDARGAHYLSGKTSPMGYNYAAYAVAQAHTVGFDTMCQKTSGMLPADCQSATGNATSSVTDTPNKPIP